ncbi:DUF4743 domain-containing protein [Chitinibacter bivalviorum]|uniref:DUF4743 domain-containing protein n=1 Tax=Chitinibacter bivalviorum TaxID=2739434 RepID=A0A7H9BFS4_9NEIS|nr:DUF4743 domain-containing protein [Chitinibacter bivalviorum]QLG87563.1 DUF4743 domain-containing protein [Chitinibacter bivalviorum]
MNAITSYLDSQPLFSTDGLLRFSINDIPLGWIEPKVAQLLQSFSAHFQSSAQQIELRIAASEIQAQMDAAAMYLRTQGFIKAWRNERYAVHPFHANGELNTEITLFTLERGAFRRFGLCSKAVHINGICTDGSLWLGKRASTKGIDPNRLDNLAAGGIPYQESEFDCVVRELAEEAGIHAELAKQAVFCGELRTQRNEIDGTHDEVLYCYDLLLPDTVVPFNTDGEVAGFQRTSIQAVITLLPSMTWDAGLVTAKLLQKQGY